MMNEKARKVLEVGDHMKDGTVVIDVDLKNDIAFFAPENIFGGNSDFDHQNDVVDKVNAKNLHGHKDWRRITSAQAEKLSIIWSKVAPPGLRGRNAPRFWSPLPFDHPSDPYGSTYRGDTVGPLNMPMRRTRSCAVPVIRSGPAKF